MSLGFANKRKIKIIASVALVFVFAGAIYYYFYISNNIEQTFAEQQQKEAALEAAKTKENVFVSDVSIALNKDQSTFEIPKTIPKSENFQMRDVIFGGYETAMGGEMKDSPLKVYDVRSEQLVSKDGKQAKLYISWRTNKLATSQIIYSKSGSVPNVLLEDGVGLSHALIIGKFEFDTRYTYIVKAKDRWGNQAQSGQYNAYSGQKADNVFTLITNEFKKIFSWAGAIR